MADDLNTETGESAAPKASSKAKAKSKGGRSNLVPALVVAAGLVGGGFLMKSKTTGDASAESASAPAASTGEHVGDCAAWDIKMGAVPGAVAKLEPISINLEPDADGTPHYAKVGIALQLADSVNHEEFVSEEIAYRALDVVNAVIVGRDMEEFASPQAFEALKDKITEDVRPLYDCEVMEVLITEFVMQ